VFLDKKLKAVGVGDFGYGLRTCGSSLESWRRKLRPAGAAGSATSPVFGELRKLKGFSTADGVGDFEYGLCRRVSSVEFRFSGFPELSGCRKFRDSSLFSTATARSGLGGVDGDFSFGKTVSVAKNFGPRPNDGLFGISGVLEPESMEPRDRFGEGEGERRMMGGRPAIPDPLGERGVGGSSFVASESISASIKLFEGKKLNAVGRFCDFTS
jgi:hypothetical protein